jgi:hypothetical protein
MEEIKIKSKIKIKNLTPKIPPLDIRPRVWQHPAIILAL